MPAPMVNEEFLIRNSTTVPQTATDFLIIGALLVAGLIFFLILRKL